MKLKDLKDVLVGEVILLEWKDEEYKVKREPVAPYKIKYLKKDILEKEVLRIDVRQDYSIVRVFIKVEDKLIISYEEEEVK